MAHGSGLKAQGNNAKSIAHSVQTGKSAFRNNHTLCPVLYAPCVNLVPFASNLPPSAVRLQPSSYLQPKTAGMANPMNQSTQ